MKNFIISVLFTTIISMVAPFRQTTTLERVMWFVVMIGILTVMLCEFDRTVRMARKKRAAGTTLLASATHIAN